MNLRVDRPLLGVQTCRRIPDRPGRPALLSPGGRRFIRIPGRTATQGTIGHYLHYQADRPVIGVLVELASETDFVAKSDDFQAAARDLAMHVAAANPTWVRREDVPDDALAKEQALIEAQARNEGKPEQVIARIVEGRLNSFYKDYVLAEQPFVNPEKFEGTVGEMVQHLAGTMGENIEVRRFVRFAVGQSDA